MTAPKSNEILAQDITYIKEDLASIKKSLETKFVSHENFDLQIKAIYAALKIQNEKSGSIIKGALILATPIYSAVIALLFKIFAA